MISSAKSIIAVFYVTLFIILIVTYRGWSVSSYFISCSTLGLKICSLSPAMSRIPFLYTLTFPQDLYLGPARTMEGNSYELLSYPCHSRPHLVAVNASNIYNCINTLVKLSPLTVWQTYSSIRLLFSSHALFEWGVHAYHFYLESHQSPPF
jgi:hypothetical protein